MYNIIDLFFSCACIFNRSSLASLLTMPFGGEGASARNVAEIWWNVRLPRVAAKNKVCVSCEFDFSVEGGGSGVGLLK